MVKSAKGKEINMESLRQANSKTVALGNGRMNARGDQLGKGGKVIKTREQLAQEYHTKNPNAVKNVPISKNVLEKPKTEKPKVDSKPVETKTAKAETKKSTKADEKVVEDKKIKESESDSEE